MTNLLLFLAVLNGLLVLTIGPVAGPFVWPGVILEGILVGSALASERMEKHGGRL